MLSIHVYGNYSPNLRGLPGSCYLLKGLTKPIMFDLGNGNFKKIKKELEKDSLDEMMLILSHNHVDHSWDVLKLGTYLISHNKKISIYLPKKSMMYWTIKNLKNAFDIHVINEDTAIKIDDYEISFCRTFHRGESYATKLKSKDHIFVYTSDFSFVSRGLGHFCENADTVLIDSGHPCKDEVISLTGYHGETQKILEKLFSDQYNVKRVLASHLKANLSDDRYLKVFPKMKSVELVKLGKDYEV